MPRDFYPDIVRLLTAAGCRYVRAGKGSHEIWYSPLSGRSFSVPRSKSRHMANAVMKDAGLPKAF